MKIMTVPVNTALNKGKEARIDIRLSEARKEFLKQASGSAGYNSLSSFILNAAIEKAHRIAERDKEILVSEQDSLIFFNALIDTAEPNDALKKASKNFKDSIHKN